ncbi:MAG: alpha-1,4-glucan--maltose-1-phosphate maltosyltransferase [Actinomycetota bacterium]|nr:MAG: alpha-1,4-glucan--maltose-1-phosphate maltosyltransferase [Actinomycetota bacterium]
MSRDRRTAATAVSGAPPAPPATTGTTGSGTRATGSIAPSAAAPPDHTTPSEHSAPAAQRRGGGAAVGAHAAPVHHDLGVAGGLLPPPLLDGRFAVLDVSPVVESGRRPAKAVVDEPVTVAATAFRDGHGELGVAVLALRPDGTTAARQPMTAVGVGLDRWQGVIRPDAMGDWAFAVQVWADPWATWLHRAQIKIPAELDVELELADGATLLERAADEREQTAAGSADGLVLRTAAAALRDTTTTAAARLAVALRADLTDVLRAHPLQDGVTTSGPWPLRVERRTAAVGSWYELFVRSEGASVDPPRSGTFATAAQRLPAVAAMGFDVVYLPPIHPIGRRFRKGPNNSLVAGPYDPGSPWAIGSPDGGHDAVHPDLGTLADFDAFVAAADGLGLQVALDLALQASPDHPWVTTHPEWFTQRADGSIAYAENPPKRYQDIYPLSFDTDPEGLYAEIRRIVGHWMQHGVRIFRVDNPHTKPLWLWDRLIGEVNATDPDVIFLAEAFTRPAMMRALAEVGFQQSYTYFTWRNGRDELTEYFSELAGPAAAYMRPNLFANTPDILPGYLQDGGPAAFSIRATLAATLSPTWGIYAGFELFENVAVHAGSEEYLDSEKYQYRPRDWAAAALQGRTLAPYLTKLNALRRAHPALQQLRDLRFHRTDDPGVIAYSKTDGADVVLVVCTLDPHSPRETLVHLDMAALGLGPADTFDAHDAITGATWTWGPEVFVRLTPWVDVAHVVTVRRLR